MISLAVRVPMTLWERWLNIRMVVRPSTSGVNLSSVRVGLLAIPPSSAPPATRLALDFALGHGLGARTLGAIDGIAIDRDRVVVGLALAPEDRKAVARRLKGEMQRSSRSATRTTSGAMFWRLMLQSKMADLTPMVHSFPI